LRDAVIVVQPAKPALCLEPLWGSEHEAQFLFADALEEVGLPVLLAVQVDQCLL
jgi:hypothetical protein